MTALPLSLSRANHRRRPLYAVLRLVIRAAALRRQRRDLSQLDTHLLRDIGVTAAEARAEASRAPWDAPENWLK